jgi:hypothetical protein
MSSMIWVDVMMDFIKGFPRVNGKSIILTVVDRFSKSTHFITPGHPYMATSAARAIFNTVVKLHGIPDSIMSDRDPMFTSQFWSELFALSDISYTCHPPSILRVTANQKLQTRSSRCTCGA